MKTTILVTALVAGELLSGIAFLNAADVCDSLPEVRAIPFKDEEVADPALSKIIAADRSAIVCLVEHLVDTRLMADPRKAPPASAFAVGDLASILLCKVTGRPFEDQLPRELRANFAQRGVTVYFEYVAMPENRAAIQADWKSWLKSRG